MYNIPSISNDTEWLWTFSGDPNQSLFQLREAFKNPYEIGRWLIFANKETVDKRWGILQAPAKLSKLGIAIQASTRLHADMYANKKGGSHVISVYTYNKKDEADVKRVRQALRELGIAPNTSLRYIPYLDNPNNTGGAKTIYYE
jgi:hypothetical protein